MYIHIIANIYVGYHPSHQLTTPVPRVPKKAPWLLALAVVMHLSITSWGIFRPSALASSVACDAHGEASSSDAFQWGNRKRNHGIHGTFEGNEKEKKTTTTTTTTTTTHVLYLDVVTEEVLLHLEILSDFTPRIRVFTRLDTVCHHTADLRYGFWSVLTCSDHMIPHSIHHLGRKSHVHANLHLFLTFHYPKL